MPFDDVHVGIKLHSALAIESLATTTSLQCTMQCNGHELCLSTNLCGNHLCQLNKIDMHMANDSDKIADPACIYSGMKVYSKPNCMENGATKNIQDDENPGFCKINQRRSDQSCSDSWEEKIDLIHDSHYKRYLYQSASGFSLHRGVSCQDSEEILEWYVYVNRTADFDNASQTCQNMGGKLFDNFKPFKLLHLVCNDLANPHWTWLGLNDRDNAGVYKNVSGGVVDTAGIAWAGIITSPGGKCLGVRCNKIRNTGRIDKTIDKYICDQFSWHIICDLSNAKKPEN